MELPAAHLAEEDTTSLSPNVGFETHELNISDPSQVLVVRATLPKSPEILYNEGTSYPILS